MQSLCIREAVDASDRVAAYRLRYDVYVRETGLRLPLADHARGVIEDHFDESAVLLIAAIGSATVGTVRSNFGDTCSFGEFHQLHRMGTGPSGSLNQVSMTSKLIVDRRHRAGRVSLALARSIFRLGMSHGIELDFIDCEARLIPFYARLGYSLSFPEPFQHPELGPRHSMHLPLDIVRLRELKSRLVSEVTA